MLSKASTAVWELLQSDEGIGKEIEEKVREGVGNDKHPAACTRLLATLHRADWSSCCLGGRRWTQRWHAWSRRIELELVR